MIVVSDTGPLNYLLLTSRVELLHRIFGTVVIPPVVVEELTDQGAAETVREWAAHPPAWLTVQAPSAVPLTFSKEGRGKGERAAVALAKELNVPILSDDRQARHTARGEGLTVSGTLGVLLEADAQGLDDIGQALAELAKTNYYLSEGLIERTLAAARQTREDPVAQTDENEPEK